MESTCIRWHSTCPRVGLIFISLALFCASISIALGPLQAAKVEAAQVTTTISSLIKRTAQLPGYEPHNNDIHHARDSLDWEAVDSRSREHSQKTITSRSITGQVENLDDQPPDAQALIAQTEAADQQQVTTESADSYYQPALIGFRCESSHETTPNGVSVIEANSLVTLTLFGDSFSTETIVAFTTEFHSELEFSDQQLPSADYLRRNQSVDLPKASTVDSSAATTTAQPSASSTISSNSIPRRRFKRSSSFDCTDYNRVVSKRLREENILSPNVAMVQVQLPELASGSYYYFCLKQPKLSGRRLKSVNNTDEQPQQLIWVHQGADWWVTLKVEPPILSMATDCVLILSLLFLSAVTSGLNLGLMSLDMNELAVISSCGDQRERSYARTIAPLRRRGNYLLCSLLLGNVMVNSTLTVILEEMTSGLVAIIGSTLAIVVLGEIVPQAFCARQGLAIGARTIYLTYAFMILTFPLSYPISRLLDYVLGEEKGNVYDRERLMEFIKITGHHTQLEADEVAIISGALKLKKIKVDQIMTRIEDVFMLPLECKLDRETIKRIIEKGYSRIPVYEFGDRKQIVALILAKDLALIDPDDHTPVANLLLYCKHPLIFIGDDTTLDVALNEFKTGKSHMAVVRQIYDDGEVDKYYEAIGVVTLEDVIEEVLQAEINDETDTLSDNRRKRRRTDAQVAHLMIDELATTTTSTSAASSASALDATSGAQVHSAAPEVRRLNAPLALELGRQSTPAVNGSQLVSHLQSQQPPAKQLQTDLSSQLDICAGSSVRISQLSSSGDSSSNCTSSNQHSGSQLLTRRATQLEDPDGATTSGGDSNNSAAPGLLSRAAQFLNQIMS